MATPPEITKYTPVYSATSTRQIAWRDSNLREILGKHTALLAGMFYSRPSSSRMKRQVGCPPVAVAGTPIM